MTHRKCPETLEELEAELIRLHKCRNYLELRDSKIASGAAYTKIEAERQIAEETGVPLGSIRRRIWEEENPYAVENRIKWEKEFRERLGFSQRDNLAQLEQDCEMPSQAQPFCSVWTGDQESFTPPKYIEAVREVMGSIDLDPASNEFAQQTVNAAVYYTKDDDGLSKPWNGNIFLNPPYSHPEVKYFVDKLLKELQPHQQAILLTNNNTDTNFFHDAAKKASMLCFTKGRINFLKPDGSYSSPTNGQVFYYFGDNKDKFAKIFSQFGIIMTVV